MSSYQVGIEVDVYLNDLTYQIARVTPQSKMREFVLQLDAEVAEKEFTTALVEDLVDVLNDEYNMQVALVEVPNSEDEK